MLKAYGRLPWQIGRPGPRDYPGVCFDRVVLRHFFSLTCSTTSEKFIDLRYTEESRV